MDKEDFENDIDESLGEDEEESFDLEIEKDEEDLATKEEKPERFSEKDKEEYGKKVKKRIDKLTYERNSERDRASQLEQELKELRERTIRLETDYTQDKEERQSAISKSEAESLQRKLTDLKKRRKDAVEAGEVDLDGDLLEQITDIKLELRERERESKRSSQSKVQQRQEETPRAVAPKELPYGSRKWLEKNTWVQDIQSNPDYARRAQMAQAIEGQLLAEGYSPHETETYEELDKRLAAAMPAKRVGKSRGGMVAGSSYDGGDTPASKSRLTRQDLTDMERIGLNPNSKKDRTDYLGYKG